MTEARATRKKAFRSLFLGGILPVIIFTLLEDHFGVLWGLIGGMVFGVGEILWEWRAQGRVDAVTWIGNGMILVLGAVSLVTQEGIWFKLQPALIEAGMSVMLIGSVGYGQPLLLAMSRKQGHIPPDAATRIEPFLKGLTLRLGLFFLAHAILATWAALHWSTTAWAVLKGVGFTLTLVIYLLVEVVLLRYRISPK